MQIRDLAIGLGFIAVLVFIGWGAMQVGQRAGQPDPVAVEPPPTFAVEGPPVGGGLYGFETLGGTLRLGDWGTLQSVEQLEDGRYELVLERDGATTTIVLSTAEILRAAAPDELNEGEAVAVRESDDGVGMLVTR